MRTLALIVGAAVIILLSAAYDARTSDRFVQMLEMRMGVTPGATRVLQDCQCTIRYLGTAVHGRRYTVQLDRLD